VNLINFTFFILIFVLYILTDFTGDIIFLGHSHRFRFNNPQEAAKLREKQLVCLYLLL